MGRLPGEGADGVHHLSAFTGHRNVHSGASVRHRTPALLREQEHLRLSCVSTRHEPTFVSLGLVFFIITSASHANTHLHISAL